MKKIKIALCQIRTGKDCSSNLERAFQMIETAAKQGAGLIAFPEMFYLQYRMKQIEENAGDHCTILNRFCDSARNFQVYICTGSMPVRRGDQIFNSAFIVGPDGKVLGFYDKCHLFDVSFDKVNVQESSLFTAGKRIDVIPCGIGNLAMQICYDIRFPESSRTAALRGAEMILVPAVFNHLTGEAHWHTLMRSRAIENQLYIAAISQARDERREYQSFGHSLVVNPWGKILAEAGEGEEIVYADIDPELICATRKKMPVFDHRRPDLYQN